MPKLTPKNHQLTEHDFIKLAKTEPHPRARTRLFILHQLQQGQTPEEIAPLFGLNPLTIHILRRKYWEFGIEQAIYDKQRPGRSSKLKPEDHQAFKQRIIEAQEKREGGRLTAEDIHTIAAQELNAHYKHSSSLYPLLHRVGMSWITARSRHPQADPEAQDAFKKTLLTK
jgi:transposase